MFVLLVVYTQKKSTMNESFEIAHSLCVLFLSSKKVTFPGGKGEILRWALQAIPVVCMLDNTCLFTPLSLASGFPVKHMKLSLRYSKCVKSSNCSQVVLEEQQIYEPVHCTQMHSEKSCLAISALRTTDGKNVSRRKTYRIEKMPVSIDVQALLLFFLNNTGLLCEALICFVLL